MTANTSIDPAVFLNRPESPGGLVDYATSGLGATDLACRWACSNSIGGRSPIEEWSRWCVVPVDPAGDLPLDGSAVGPGGSAVVDGLGLEQADGGLAQRVVQGVTDGADRAGDAVLEAARR